VRARSVVCVVAVVVTGAACITCYAILPTSRSARHTAPLSYSTTDVVEYLAFATGPVVADHPALARPELGGVKVPPAAQLHAVAVSLTGCIHSLDASAGPALTAAFNAADPQRLDNAVHRFNAAAQRWLTAPYQQDDPCPPPPPPPKSPPPEKNSDRGWWKVVGDILAYWVLGGAVAVGAGVSVTVGAVFNVLVLAMSLLVVAETGVLVAWIFPAFLSYEFENTPTDLDRQTAIGKVVAALRS